MRRDDGYFVQGFKNTEYQVFLLLDNCKVSSGLGW